MEHCVNVVAVAPVMTLGEAIVIELVFIAAVILIYADLKVFEKGRKAQHRKKFLSFSVPSKVSFSPYASLDRRRYS